MMNQIVRPSLIRDASRKVIGAKGINLAQGTPEDRPHSAALAVLTGTVNEATKPGRQYEEVGKLFKSCQDPDILNQYCDPNGLPELRRAIARYYEALYSLKVDAETEVTVCLGATGGMSAALRALVALDCCSTEQSPGLGTVILLTPAHEMYFNQCSLFKIRCEEIALELSNDGSHWQLPSTERLNQALDAIAQRNEKLSAIVLNNPQNPTGKVFTDAELEVLLKIAEKYHLKIITDDIYEHIVYGEKVAALEKSSGSVPPLWKTVEGSQSRRNKIIMVNSASKTLSASGWRIGWVIAEPRITTVIRAVNDTLVVQAPTPFQWAVAQFMTNPPKDFFQKYLRELYWSRFEILASALREVGFRFATPDGAYYIYADYSNVRIIAEMNSEEAANWLIYNVGVGSVPGSAFYLPGIDKKFLRFAFCKREETLKGAADHFRAWHKRLNLF